MSKSLIITMIAAAFLALSGSSTVFAQDPLPPAESLKEAFPAQKHFSPYAGRNFPTQVYWGDTHLHTGMSMDAGAFGARLTPEDAYRFARGEELTSSTGLRVKLSRPLDFLVVADHAENLGLTFGLEENNKAILGTKWGRGLADLFAAKTEEALAKSYLYWASTFADSEKPTDPLAGTGFDEIRF